MRTSSRHRLLVALTAAGVVGATLALPATTHADSFHSVSGHYQTFTVPVAEVPGGKCDVSPDGGLELYGNIGPAGTWAGTAMGASGDDCVGSFGPMEPGLYYYEYVATL
ncbi:MAG: hypothetical protein LBV00_11595, partial [Propionibacteriaceae bacterium]|nr:hypothetical protein [Propionibacteriaceae bacterium]